MESVTLSFSINGLETVQATEIKVHIIICQQLLDKDCQYDQFHPLIMQRF